MHGDEAVMVAAGMATDSEIEKAIIEILQEIEHYRSTRNITALDMLRVLSGVMNTAVEATLLAGARGKVENEQRHNRTN